MSNIDSLMLFLSVAIPTGLGWILLNELFGGKKNFLLCEKIVLGYGLGYGCVTICMFYFSLFRIHFSLSVLLALLTFLGILAKIYGRFNSKKEYVVREVMAPAIVHKRISDPLSILLLTFFIVNISLIFFRTVVIEKDIWDSWAFWAFKAKIFFHHRIIPLELFQQFKTVWGNWDYPHHVPLMETWTLLWLGYWNDQLPRMLFPLFYIGISVICLYLLRRYIPLKNALAGACFIVSFPALQIWTMGTISEPVLLFYYIGSFALLYRWMHEGDGRLLVLSALFIGLAGWTKNEGLMLIMCNTAVLLVFLIKEKGVKAIANRAVWLYLIPPLAIIIPWNIYKKIAEIEHYLFHSGYLQSEKIPVYLVKIGKIGHLFWYYFSNLKSWNILWMLLISAVVYNLIRQKKNKSGYVLLSIGIQFVVYVFLFMTYPQEKVFVYDAMERLMLGPAILAIIYWGLMFQPSPQQPKTPADSGAMKPGQTVA